MLVVGLTGGIASGKSTVSRLLTERHRLPLLDADVLAREAIEPGTSGFSLVVSHFGPDRVLRADGTLDRAALGDIVFGDTDERRWLNGVVHPRVKKAIFWGVVCAWLRGEWVVVLDVPLLVEAGLHMWVAEVVVVYVNERLQLSRLLARPSDPPLSPAQASARISSQLPLSTKLVSATSVIDNSGTLADLDAQVDRLVGRWRAQQGGTSLWWARVCRWVPPVGLVAGLVALLRKRLRSKGRRKGRGEVERTDRVEEIEMKVRRRGTGSGASGSARDRD
ncbi:Dephospho-CoA kinase cab5 [Cryptotrichosporon argae]